jgi:hypothetical protein
LTRLIKLDEKKLLWLNIGGKFDQDTWSNMTTFGQKKATSKIDTQNIHMSISNLPEQLES